MDAKDLIAHRMNGIVEATLGLVVQSEGIDWTTPVLPATSPIAVTLWHVPRTLDWLVNGSVRGATEVADTSVYGSLPDPNVFGFGTGLTEDQVSVAAAAIGRAAVIDYAKAVQESLTGWFAELDPATLDEPVTGFDDRQMRRPSYCTSEALAEIEGLGDLPLGILLARPGMGHLFWHLGEADLLLQQAQRLAKASD
jgi:hypothetical protein